MELEEDKKRLAMLHDETSKRREERDTKFAKNAKGAKKPEKNLNSSIKGSEKYRSMEEHRIPLEELFQKLEVNPEKGLSDAEAHERNLKYGDNALSGKSKTPWYILLLHEMTTFFAMLLWIGGILSILAYLLDREDPSNVNPFQLSNNQLFSSFISVSCCSLSTSLLPLSLTVKMLNQKLSLMPSKTSFPPKPRFSETEPTPISMPPRFVFELLSNNI